MCFFRAESTIVFSWLHQEATKEINLVNPVNPVRKCFWFMSIYYRVHKIDCILVVFFKNSSSAFADNLCQTGLTGSSWFSLPSSLSWWKWWNPIRLQRNDSCLSTFWKLYHCAVSVLVKFDFHIFAEGDCNFLAFIRKAKNEISKKSC